MITQKQVQHVAKLAHIHLGEEEVDTMTQELRSVLQYFSILSQVKVKHDPLVSQGVLSGREDVAVQTEEGKSKKILSASSSLEGSVIKVSQLFDR